LATRLWAACLPAALLPKTKMENNIYDLIIIGAGPAGLTASIYASRYKMKHLVFAKEPGGQMNEIHKIENWPGEISISGFELARRMVEQAKNLGAEIKSESIVKIEKGSGGFKIFSSTGEYSAKNVIFTIGTEYKTLNIPGEKEFKGKGVSYCATCDAAFFKGKTVSVVGGGNSAAAATLLLAEYAEKIYLIYRGEKLKCDPAFQEKISASEKIEVIFDTNVREIRGEDGNKVDKVVLDKKYNDSEDLEVQGVFVEIGSEPGIELLRPLGVETDEKNFIKVGPDNETNVPGIYAAGDVTTGSNGMRQIITAAAEGAVAAGSVYRKLQISN
jgi:thioredoxin reductase (NADPH)